MDSQSGIEQNLVKPRVMLFVFIILMLLLACFSGVLSRMVRADNSVVLGDTLTLNGGGFQPGEKISLWTTDPSNAAVSAGYTYSDKSGNIQLRVETADPLGLAAAVGTNYSIPVTVRDSNGNVLSQYQRIILLKPVVGLWSLTAFGSSTNFSKVFVFNIVSTIDQPGTTPPPPATTPPNIPAPAPASSVGTSPSEGTLGTIFVMNGSGFQPGEKISLWTTDPHNSALGAGYTLADKYGNIQMRVETSDPQGLTKSSSQNYSEPASTTNPDGTVTNYQRIILVKPVIGSWALTAQALSNGYSKVFSFNLTSPASAPNQTVSPGSGPLGTTFQITSGGFLANEAVFIWTTDPSGQTRSSSSIPADPNGIMQVHIETTDPQGLTIAAGTNVSIPVTVTDGQGHVLARYLRVILYKPTVGAWRVTALGGSSTGTVNIVFNITG